MSRSEPLPESLSALMDGETARPEEERLLKVLQSDSGARARWAHYHLIADAMRNRLPPGVDDGLAERVAGALEAEPIYLLRRRRHLSTPQWVKQAGELALVASVTAIAILGVQSYTRTDAPTGLTRPLQVADAGTAQPVTTMAAVAPMPSVSPRMRTKVNNMLVNHGEVTSGLPMQGVMPYVRLVNYETGR